MMDRYRHLWQPKKSAYDYGKTEYKIVRNWTPRAAIVAREAAAKLEQQSQQGAVGEASQEGQEEVLPTRSFTSLKVKVPTAEDLVPPSGSGGGSFIGLLGRLKSHNVAPKASVAGDVGRMDGGSGELPLAGAVQIAESVISGEKSHGNSDDDNGEKVSMSRVFELGFSGRNGGGAGAGANPEPVEEEPVFSGRSGGDTAPGTGANPESVEGSGGTEGGSTGLDDSGLQVTLGPEHEDGLESGGTNVDESDQSGLESSYTDAVDVSEYVQSGSMVDQEAAETVENVVQESDASRVRSDKSELGLELGQHTMERDGSGSAGLQQANLRRAKAHQRTLTEDPLVGHVTPKAGFKQAAKPYATTSGTVRKVDPMSVHVRSKQAANLKRAKPLPRDHAEEGGDHLARSGRTSRSTRTRTSSHAEETSDSDSYARSERSLRAKRAKLSQTALETSDLDRDHGRSERTSKAKRSKLDKTTLEPARAEETGQPDRTIARSDRSSRAKQAKLNKEPAHTEATGDPDGILARSERSSRQAERDKTILRTELLVGRDKPELATKLRQANSDELPLMKSRAADAGDQDWTLPKSGRTSGHIQRRTRPATRSKRAKAGELVEGSGHSDPDVGHGVTKSERPSRLKQVKLVLEAGNADGSYSRSEEASRSRLAKPYQAIPGHTKDTDARPERTERARRLLDPDTRDTDPGDTDTGDLDTGDTDTGTSDTRRTHALSDQRSRQANKRLPLSERSRTKVQSTRPKQRASHDEPDRTALELSQLTVDLARTGRSGSGQAKLKVAKPDHRKVKSSLRDRNPAEGDAGSLGGDVTGLYHGVGSEGEWSEGIDMMPSSGRKRRQPSSASATGSKKKKIPEGELTSMKLWCPKDLHRKSHDLSELDVCMSIYDTALKEALGDTEDTEVQQMLAQHWKKTQRNMLTVIEGSHAVNALEKKCRQEKLKSNTLQKKLHSRLAFVKEAGEEHRLAVGRSAKARKAAQMKSLKEKIQVEACELRPLLSKLFFK